MDIIQKQDEQEYVPNFIIKILEDLIDIKGINIKKLYKINKEFLEHGLLNIKKIYCSYRNNKNKICLNRCVNNNKYCKIHEPIKREEKRQKRIILNEKKKLFKIESKLFLDINYEIGKEYKIENIPKEPLPAYDIYPIPYAPSYEEIKDKPSDLNGILGNIVKEMLRDKFRNSPKICNEKIIKISKGIENIKVHNLEYYKEQYKIKGGEGEVDFNYIVEAKNKKLIEKINQISGDIDIIPLIDKLLITNNGEYIPDIEEYKENINKINFQEICDNFKGVNIQRLYRSTIENQIKLLLMKNTNTNINSKLIKFINNIVKKLPK